MLSLSSTISQSVRVKPGRSLLQLSLLGMLMSGCGIAANHKPIPSGLPTASIHFGPVVGGFRSQGVHVNDGEFCHPAEFARYHTIGSYLGSDLDVVVPASQTLFVSLTNSENHGCVGGLCTTSCGGGVSFSPKPGEKYTARLEYQGKDCALVVNLIQRGVEVPVATRPELQRCLY